MLRLGVDDYQDTKTLVRNSDTQRMGVAYGSGGSVLLPQRWQSTGLCGATFVTYYNICKHIHAYIYIYIYICVCVCGRPGCARPCYNTVAPPARRLKGPTAAPSSMLDASPSPPQARPPNQKEQDILNPAGWMEHLARQPASLTQSSSPGDPSPGY